MEINLHNIMYCARFNYIYDIIFMFYCCILFTVFYFTQREIVAIKILLSNTLYSDCISNNEKQTRLEYKFLIAFSRFGGAYT